MDYFVERPPGRLPHRRERAVRRIAEGDQPGTKPILGVFEYLASQVLLGNRGMPGADTKRSGGQCDAHRDLPEVVLDRLPYPIVVRDRGDQRDGRSRSGDVTGATPDL